MFFHEKKLQSQRNDYELKLLQLARKNESQIHSQENAEQEIISALLPRLLSHHKKRKLIMKGKQTFTPLTIPEKGFESFRSWLLLLIWNPLKIKV